METTDSLVEVLRRVGPGLRIMLLHPERGLVELDNVAVEEDPEAGDLAERRVVVLS